MTWFTEFNTNCIGKITTTRASGDVWFGTDVAGIGRIKPTGRVSFLNIANNSAQATALALDKKSGNIWYIESAGSSVGFITPAGGGMAFDVGQGGNSFGIAFGPDGRIWFADPNNKRIGRINTNGAGPSISAEVSPASRIRSRQVPTAISTLANIARRSAGSRRTE